MLSRAAGFDGVNLRTLIDEHHDEIMGDDPEHEMIRIAYMDSIDNLSIQVHPGGLCEKGGRQREE